MFVECLFGFQDLSRQMKVMLNDFTSFLNKSANDDVFLNMELQLKEATVKREFTVN